MRAAPGAGRQIQPARIGDDCQARLLCEGSAPAARPARENRSRTRPWVLDAKMAEDRHRQLGQILERQDVDARRCAGTASPDYRPRSRRRCQRAKALEPELSATVSIFINPRTAGWIDPGRMISPESREWQIPARAAGVSPLRCRSKPSSSPCPWETRFTSTSCREAWHRNNYGPNTRRSRPENEYGDDRFARSNNSSVGMAGRTGRPLMARSWESRVGRRRHQGHSARTFLESIGANSSISVRGESLSKTIECARYVGIRWFRSGIEGDIPLRDFRRAAQTSGRQSSVGGWAAAARIFPGSSRPAGTFRRRRCSCWPSKGPTSRITGGSPTRGRPQGREQVVDTGREAPERPLSGGQARSPVEGISGLVDHRGRRRDR